MEIVRDKKLDHLTCTTISTHIHSQDDKQHGNKQHGNSQDV